jgi:hypothetical protein
LLPKRRLFARGLPIANVLLALAPVLLAAQVAIDEEAPWPRVRSTNGNTVTLHLPQVERWTSNSFVARAVVGVKPLNAKKDFLGVIWFEAHGRVDRTNRLVTLDQFEVTKGRFPEATDGGSNALAIAREIIPSGARTVSLDYLITALGFEQAAARQGIQGLNHKPPAIIWATNRTVLVLIDGEPHLQPVAGTAFERVVNTPVLLVRDKSAGRFYLEGNGQWFAAGSIAGPWSLAQSPPAEVATLSASKTEPAPVRAGEPPPRIIVSTSPAELLMTADLPDFRPIRGTALQYAADTDSLLFFHTTRRESYVLISGRWFKATSLKGPWTYVAPRDLPEDFAKIPPGSPQAIVLASVPDTPQAELALVANSVPTTATVNRNDARIELNYDGEPKFKPIEGTAMSYAVNAPLPVVRTGTNYYALDDGVWFVGVTPTGPWQVAAEVPEEIYTIPPNSPVYYATFARVYDADAEKVEVGYTPGYTGSYENDGTMVYGTGWDYESWSGDDYYGWGWTWGYSYGYVPWYGWWVWRPWWNEQGGLRAAVIDNIYDRWQSRPGVTPHDGSAGVRSDLSNRERYTGHPATYGRYRGSTRAGPMTTPATTLALNPYSRPKTPVRSGDIPHGAQLLTNLRQTSGGGRDLYASPDGNVYQRRNDGWYRREVGGNWSFAAPTQGKIERGQVAGARGAQPPGGGAGYRIAPGANAATGRMQGRGDRVPDVGTQARAQEIAALEREYYARSLAQMRTQNTRSARGGGRAMRGGGRRR